MALLSISRRCWNMSGYDQWPSDGGAMSVLIGEPPQSTAHGVPVSSNSTAYDPGYPSVIIQDVLRDVYSAIYARESK